MSRPGARVRRIAAGRRDVCDGMLFGDAEVYMPARREDGRRTGRWLRERAAAGGLLVAALLVFTWPFVRQPPLDLGDSFVHLLLAWGASVVALALMARALGRRGRRSGDRDA